MISAGKAPAGAVQNTPREASEGVTEAMAGAASAGIVGAPVALWDHSPMPSPLTARTCTMCSTARAQPGQRVGQVPGLPDALLRCPTRAVVGGVAEVVARDRRRARHRRSGPVHHQAACARRDRVAVRERRAARHVAVPVELQPPLGKRPGGGPDGIVAVVSKSVSDEGSVIRRVQTPVVLSPTMHGVAKVMHLPLPGVSPVVISKHYAGLQYRHDA